MLILEKQRLVVFETPKTGSLALRAMLHDYTCPVSIKISRHMNYGGYQRNFAGMLEQDYGVRPQTIAVLREPLERMQSWYRYRRRKQVSKLAISTQNISFEQFMLDYLDPEGATQAAFGRQDRFVAWDGAKAKVDHLFDYAQLPLLEAFLSERIGVELRLPVKNKSPTEVSARYAMSQEVLLRYQTIHLEEMSLYHEVASVGHLIRPDLETGAGISNSAH